MAKKTRKKVGKRGKMKEVKEELPKKEQATNQNKILRNFFIDKIKFGKKVFYWFFFLFISYLYN